MAITRTAMVDDDGSGTTGTIFNNAWKTELYGQIDAALLGGSGITANVVTTSATGTVHNLACGPASLLTVIQCSNASDLTLTGVSFTTAPRAGDLLLVRAQAAGVVFLAHLHAGSTYKFGNLASSAATPLKLGRALYVWDGAAFVLHHHEQGAWITPAFNAADYTGGGGAWTVAAGHILMCRYRLQAKTLFWSVYVSGSTIAAGATALRALFGFTADGTGYFAGVHSFVDSATSGMSYAQHNGAQITLYKTVVGAGFAAGTLRLSASGFCEVT